jgi:hypothetical protein
MIKLFQRIITEMLSGIKGVGVYVDDVIIATKTFEALFINERQTAKNKVWHRAAKK